MLKTKITFLDLLRIVFSFLVAGDGYYTLVIFHGRVTINIFQKSPSALVKNAYELVTLTNLIQGIKSLFREVVSVRSKYEYFQSYFYGDKLTLYQH